MLAWRQHQAVGTCGARGVGDDISVRLCPKARRLFVTSGRESTAAAGRLALALWETPLSAAGLFISVRAFAARRAATVTESLWCVRLRAWGRRSETRSAALAARRDAQRAPMTSRIGPCENGVNLNWLSRVRAAR
jgi:hypothetical protein